MTKYDLCIEFNECDDDTKKLCLSRMQYKDDCNMALTSCHYPMIINPLCTCNNIDKCLRCWKIEKHKDKIYIFYTCVARCTYFIKDLDSAIKSILEPMESPYIYWGKDLKKLIKKVFSDKDKPSSYDKSLDFFENLFTTINTRM